MPMLTHTYTSNKTQDKTQDKFVLSFVSEFLKITATLCMIFAVSTFIMQ